MHGHGKAHDGGEEVRHGFHPEGAAAGLGKALGNRQAQAGAAIRAALVTPHKPGGEVHTFRQLIAGGIAKGGDCRLVGGFQREIDAASRQTVILPFKFCRFIWRFNFSPASFNFSLFFIWRGD